MPLKIHEDICVFYSKLPTYNPQMMIRSGGEHSRDIPKHQRCGLSGEQKDVIYRPGIYAEKRIKVFADDYYPNDILTFPKPHKPLHTCEKPVDLLEWLIRTYTLEGETVLDSCMGSGSTGEACINTGRDFIGIELDKKYYDIASERCQFRSGGIIKI